MPYTREHKRRTRQRILASAFALFSRRGFDNVSIDELMEHAGLTRGGFYAHFASKAEVYAEAIGAAVAHSRLGQEKPAEMDERTWTKGLLEAYLSREHVEAESGMCPLAFLATDVGIRNREVRSAYGKGYEKLHAQVVERVEAGPDDDPEEIAFAVTAMMIGCVAIGRALPEKATGDRLLAACRRQAWKLLNPARE